MFLKLFSIDTCILHTNETKQSAMELATHQAVSTQLIDIFASDWIIATRTANTLQIIPLAPLLR